MLAFGALEALRDALAVVGVILVVVGFHEFGHFAFAKWSGIRVDEFSIGFGPRLVSRRRGETLYSVRALPLGGFVRMPGMTDLDAAPEAGDRNFNRASIPRRAVTILAGVLFNFLLAGILFSVQAIPAQGSQIARGSALYGRVPNGSQLLQVGARRIDRSSEDALLASVHAATRATLGRPVDVVYRDPSGAVRTAHAVRPFLELADGELGTPLGQTLARRQQGDGSPLAGTAVVDTIDGRPVHPGDPASLFPSGGAGAVAGHMLTDPSLTFAGTVTGAVDGDGAIGRVEVAWKLGIGLERLGRPLPAAIATGFRAVPDDIRGIVGDVYSVVSTPNTGGVSNFSGPVGIARATAQSTQAGWLSYIGWMGFISVNLGFLNLLPIPFLDGGRFALLAVEAVRRRRLDPRREMALVMAGAFLLVTFFVLVTVNDIKGF